MNMLKTIQKQAISRYLEDHPYKDDGEAYSVLEQFFTDHPQAIDWPSGVHVYEHYKGWPANQVFIWLNFDVASDIAVWRRELQSMGAVIQPVFSAINASFGLSIGECWVHHSGRVYTVLGIANDATSHPDEFPVSVVYRGENGNVWVRPLSEFLTKFTKKNVLELDDHG